jgi:ABC-2 type transport system permease protein
MAATSAIANCHTSEPSVRGAGLEEAGRGWWSRCLAVYRLELRIQWREPATWLYALVFLLLTFGFVSSGTVELVRDRGALPKLSPLAIALALGGLTAFGQVITTMITASAILRDGAWRTDHLLATTALDGRAWVVGRWAAASTVMVLVYGGLLLGVLLGASAPWVERDVAWSTVLLRALWPWLTLTVPTTLAVGALLVAAAVRTRTLLGVLGTALALVFLWQGCEAMARRDVPVPWQWLSALADPFGTVAVQQVTGDWSESMRATALIPVTGLVGASRVLWVGVALVVAGVTLRGMPGVVAVRAPARSDRDDGASTAVVVPLRGRSALRTVAAFTARWTWRERGWRVIALLGVLNVFVQALGTEVAAGATIDGGMVVALVREHARLFLILLATIYAGELLWRDQDQRVVELVASTPVATRTLVGGRVLGLMASQVALVTALLAAAIVGVMLRSRAPIAATPVLIGGALWVLLPFMQWLVLSLAVHVAIRHKVIAHLLLIAGWVAAVALDANGVTSPWVRFADPPALMAGEPLPIRDAALRALWWSSVSAVLFTLTLLGWRRATSRR